MAARQRRIERGRAKIAYEIRKKEAEWSRYQAEERAKRAQAKAEAEAEAEARRRRTPKNARKGATKRDRETKTRGHRRNGQPRAASKPPPPPPPAARPLLSPIKSLGPPYVPSSKRARLQIRNGEWRSL